MRAGPLASFPVYASCEFFHEVRSTPGMLREYLPVLLLLGFVAVNAVVIIWASENSSRARGPRPSSRQPYESGMAPLGDARDRFSVKFYMVAMLFIVFDIETVFMIPWGAYYRQLSCAVPLVDRRLSRGTAVVLRPRRDAGLHGHPARRLRLRLEEGSAAMGLIATDPPADAPPCGAAVCVRRQLAGQAGSPRDSTSW